MSKDRRVASVLLSGLGLLFLVPPVYATILDWRAESELNWFHLRDMLPLLLDPGHSLLCCGMAYSTPKARFVISD
jgi:hypothetical protein